MLDHPALVWEGYTTVLLSWADGRLRVLEPLPADGSGVLILDAYFAAYLCAFAAIHLSLRRQARTGRLAATTRDVWRLTLVGVLGTLLGAKLLYAVVYHPGHFRQHPTDLLLNWSGMASHGAAAGVFVALLLWARARRRSLLPLTDAFAVIAPLCGAFVRVANFLNGELYGRAADVAWAMRFPLRDAEGRPLLVDGSGALRAILPDGGLDAATVEAGWVRGPALLDAAGDATGLFQAATDPRHPAQLYQMLVEGLLLYLLLLLARRRVRPAGQLTVLFLFGYCAGRFLTEFFRQPDAQLGTVLGPLSMGQVLSLAGLAAGAIFWVHLRRAREREH